MKNLLKKLLESALDFKVLVGIVVIFSIIKLLNSSNTDGRLYKDLISQQQKYKQLSKHAASLEIKYVTQKELKAKLEAEWKNEKNALRGRVKILSNATYLIREKSRKTNRADLVYRGKKIKYVFSEIRFKSGPPVGYVMIMDDGKVVSKIYNHVIDIKTAISRDEDTGRYSVVSKANFKLRSGHLKPDNVNWYDKPYPLKIVGGTALIDPTEKSEHSQFYLWSPRLSAGFNVGINTNGTFTKPAIGVSLMGYGTNRRDLDFKFLHFGIGLGRKSNDFDLNFAPLYWRPFRNTLPNTYTGVGAGIGSNGASYFWGLNFNF